MEICHALAPGNRTPVRQMLGQPDEAPRRSLQKSEGENQRADEDACGAPGSGLPQRQRRQRKCQYAADGPCRPRGSAVPILGHLSAKHEIGPDVLNFKERPERKQRGRHHPHGDPTPEGQKCPMKFQLNRQPLPQHERQRELNRDPNARACHTTQQSQEQGLHDIDLQDGCRRGPKHLEDGDRFHLLL